MTWIVLLYSASVTFLAACSAALTSLGVLSVRGSDNEPEGTRDWLVVRAIDDPVNTGVALGIARAVSVLLVVISCLLYTSPSPRDRSVSRMPSSA